MIYKSSQRKRAENKQKYYNQLAYKLTKSSLDFLFIVFFIIMSTYLPFISLFLFLSLVVMNVYQQLIMNIKYIMQTTYALIFKTK